MHQHTRLIPFCARSNFFEGDGLVPSSATDEQKVGGCLLDKVDAIKNENGEELDS